MPTFNVTFTDAEGVRTERIEAKYVKLLTDGRRAVIRVHDESGTVALVPVYQVRSVVRVKE
ncbi:MAG: hypothetical protein OXB98_06655 [Bryobacterales bacterium]|nr:hypothetical protein [Bryobacterales bacterium]